MRWRALPTALLLSLGCSEPGGAPVTASFDSTLVVSEVEARVRAFHTADTARSSEGVVALLWPDYSMLVDGARVSYDEVVAGSSEFMPSLDLFHTEWSDVRVIPLTREIALSSFLFRDSIITSTGELIRARGPTTFLWQRRDGEWRILFGDADHYPIEP